MTPTELLARWRSQATTYERDGVTVGALVLERCAQELEAALAAGTGQEERLSLNAAALRCGYSPDHLGRLVKAGKLQNYGTRRRPLVCAADLPRKPRLTAPRRAGIVRAQ